jgi:microcystin-dependent protein
MPNPVLGEIRLFAGNYAPVGWAICDGRLESVAANQALFGLIGTLYGGDGFTKFGLPDLRSRVPIHAGGQYQLGEKAGTEMVSLYTGQMPTHTHTVNASTAGGFDDPTNNFWGGSPAKPYSTPPGNLTMNPASVSAAGKSLPHENRIPFLAINYIISLNGVLPSEQTTPYLGEIRIFPFFTNPSGWFTCNGQLLPISNYTALFTLLTNTYGGNGKTNFALPDLQGAVPMKTSPDMPLGQKSGESTHTLKLAEIPAHNHLANAAADTAISPLPAGNFWGSNTGYTPYGPKGDTTMFSQALGNSGGGQPHENMAPFLVLTICIAVHGEYPVQ